MYLHFQPDATHADGLAHILLPIYDEFLIEDMQNLLVIENVHCLRGFHYAFDVQAGSLPCP